MRDADVREAMRQRLDEEHAGDEASTLVLDELGLCGAVRVDVAVVNGSLSGFELKSARDTLKRLPAQVDTYSRVLDHATLVVAENHAAQAVPMLPSWWGVIEAQVVEGMVQLVDVVPSAQNPSVDPFSLVQLLWRDEALTELVERGLDRGVRSKPRNHIWNRLASELPIDELRDVVRGRLKSRAGWRSVP